MSDRPPLDVDAVRRRCGDRWPRIDVVDEVGSTNAELVATAGECGDHEVLVAERQTSGRGRLERAWTSPPRAGLLFSALVRPRAPMDRWGWLPLLTGVALAEAVEDIAGVAASLKWPNDLLLGAGADAVTDVGAARRKAAGVLVQTSGSAVVIGIGLNVTTTADELPVPTATSLAIEGARLDRADLLAAVLTRLDRRLTAFDGGDPGLRDAYRRRCSTVGLDVRVTLEGRPAVTGRVVDIDEAGALVVGRGDDVVVLHAGDVEHVRPHVRPH